MLNYRNACEVFYRRDRNLQRESKKRGMAIVLALLSIRYIREIGARATGKKGEAYKGTFNMIQRCIFLSAMFFNAT